MVGRPAVEADREAEPGGGLGQVDGEQQLAVTDAAYLPSVAWETLPKYLGGPADDPPD